MGSVPQPNAAQTTGHDHGCTAKCIYPAGIIRKKTPVCSDQTAHQRQADAAAMSVSRQGAASSIPAREEVTAALDTMFAGTL